MTTCRFCSIGVIILFTLNTDAPAQPALSPRNANYTIEVKLDPQKKML